MKKILFISAIVLTITFLSTSFSYYDGNTGAVIDAEINFLKEDVEKAREEAKNESKLIFIDTYADWCRPCKMMDKQVFTDEKVIKYFNDHFVAVKIDGEKGKGPDFMKKHNIRGYPTFVIMDADEKVLHQFAGFYNADKFLKEVKKASSK